MKNIHLTDMEIQQYLFEKDSCDGSAINHISHCDICKAKSAVYQMLSSEMKNMQRPVFDFNLADLLLSRLPSQKPKLSFTIFLVNSLAVAGISLLFVSIFLLQAYIRNAFIDTLPSSSYLIVVAAIVLIIFRILDIYKGFQHKMVKLNGY